MSEQLRTSPLPAPNTFEDIQKRLFLMQEQRKPREEIQDWLNMVLQLEEVELIGTIDGDIYASFFNILQEI